MRILRSKGKPFYEVHKPLIIHRISYPSKAKVVRNQVCKVNNKYFDKCIGKVYNIVRVNLDMPLLQFALDCSEVLGPLYKEVWWRENEIKIIE